MSVWRSEPSAHAFTRGGVCESLFDERLRGLAAAREHSGHAHGARVVAHESHRAVEIARERIEMRILARHRDGSELRARHVCESVAQHLWSPRCVSERRLPRGRVHVHVRASAIVERLLRSGVLVREPAERGGRLGRALRDEVLHVALRFCVRHARGLAREDHRQCA